MTAREITQARLPGRIEARIADARCLLTSDTTMTGAAARWRAQLHGGTIPMPDDGRVPVSVISFATATDGKGLFVMTTPTIWRSGKVDGGPLGLETLMVAVLLHEATHVSQSATYGERMDRLSKRWSLPEDFNDDSIQERFAGTPGYADAIAQETQLLLDAAAAPTRAEARRIASQARTAMLERQKRWFPASDAYLVEAEDIWLTMEGSAQWSAFQWLVSPRGGAIARPEAMSGFAQRSKWWTQTEGFALFMTLDRLTGGEWKRHAFNDGAKSGLQMLDEALAN